MTQFVKHNNIWTPDKTIIKASGDYGSTNKRSVKDDGSWLNAKEESGYDPFFEATLYNRNSTSAALIMYGFYTDTDMNVILVGSDKKVISTTTIPAGSGTGAGSTITLSIPPQTKAKLYVEGSYTTTNEAAGIAFALNDVIESIDYINPLRYTPVRYPVTRSTALVKVPNTLPAHITILNNVFVSCTKFNDPTVGEWDVSKVKMFTTAFSGCSIFNQPLPWNTASGEIMTRMFNQATAFNRNISNWNVSKVTTWVDFRTGSGLSLENTPAKFR